MDVGRLLLDRVEDDPVDQPHQRAVAGGRLLLGDILIAALQCQPVDQFMYAGSGPCHRFGRLRRTRPAALSAVDEGRAGRRCRTVMALDRIGDVLD